MLKLTYRRSSIGTVLYWSLLVHVTLVNAFTNEKEKPYCKVYVGGQNSSISSLIFVKNIICY